MKQTVILGMLLLFALGDSCSPTPNVVGVQQYGAVTGRVLDATTNKPIPGALVSVGSVDVAQADARGAFTVNRVPIGDQTVTARAPGYGTADADVTIQQNQGVSVGYLRLVPVTYPVDQPTLPPPATPSPSPSPSPSASPSASPGPSSSPAPSPSAAPSPAASATP